MKHSSAVPEENSSGHTKAESSSRSSRAEKTNELNERLNAIYKNEDGELPDMQSISIRRPRTWLTALVIILFLAVSSSAGAWLYFFYLNPPSNQATRDVTLAISGPALTDFGATTTYTISYTNTSPTTLLNPTLTVRFPTGFVMLKSSQNPKKGSKNEWDLNPIESGERGTLTISGRLYGGNRESRSWRSFLTYQGASLNSEVQETASFETTIVNSPYSLRIDGPATVPAGSEATYTFTVATNETAFASNLELAPNWGENFAITSSSPALSKTLRWTILKGSTSTETHFQATGILNDSIEKNQTIKAGLQVLADNPAESVTVSTANLITELTPRISGGLALAINGSSAPALTQGPGDLLNITLNFKNTTESPLKDGVLRLVFQAPSLKRQSVINWTKLNDKLDGDLRGEQISDTIRQATLSWNKKQLPALANLIPGDEVSLTLSVPIKDTSLFDLENSKERTITLTGGFSFATSSGTPKLLPLSPRKIVLTSDISFENRDSVTSDTAGNETHSLTWIISHSFGNLKNVKLSADVFPTVTFNQTSTAPAGIANFDNATKHLTWVIPEIPESVDVLAWPFSLMVTNRNPGQNTLISKITLEAEDESGQPIRRESTPTLLASP